MYPVWFFSILIVASLISLVGVYAFQIYVSIADYLANRKIAAELANKSVPNAE